MAKTLDQIVGAEATEIVVEVSERKGLREVHVTKLPNG